jgi:hypothetical protein
MKNPLHINDNKLYFIKLLINRLIFVWKKKKESDVARPDFPLNWTGKQKKKNINTNKERYISRKSKLI